MRSRRVRGAAPGAFGEGAGAGPGGRGAAEDPRAVGKRVQSLDLGALGGKPERLGADAEVGGRLGQVEPRLDAVIGRAMHRDLVMRAERRHPLTRPTVAMASSIRAPTNRITASSFGKMPTTSARRLISLFSRSRGFVEAICAQCSL